MSRSHTRPFIRALLIDISGNLHIGSKPTPDAVGAFERLRASGMPYRLCSNTSKESTQSLVKRLNGLGFDVGDSSLDASWRTDNSAGTQRYQQNQRSGQEVWTSIGALAQYIRNQGLKKPFLLLSPSAKEEVIQSSCIRDLPKGLVESPDYDSVIVGLTPELFDYSHLNTAFRILKGEHRQQRSGVTHSPSSCPGKVNVQPEELTPPRLIATHKAKYIQTENPEGLSLGPGPFVLALETAAGVEAYVIGKPTRLFFQTVIDDFYASGELEQVGDRGMIAVIGDDIEADLGDGAIQMGLWRILVKTGKYRAGDEGRPGTVPPDEVFDSFAAFVKNILTMQALPHSHRNKL